MALPVQAVTPKSEGPFPTNPFPLGISKPATAGTAVQLVHNFTDLEQRVVNYLTIQAPINNKGDVYIVCEPMSNPPGAQPPWNLLGGGTTSGADLTNYLNVIQILSPGVSWSVPSWMLNMVRLGQFWVDVTVAGQNNDFVIAVAGEA